MKYLKIVWKAIKSFFKSYIWVAPLAVIVDLVSKVIADKTQCNVSLIPSFLSFSISYNTGAAWSMFNEHPGILVAVSVIGTLALIGWLVYRYKKYNLANRIALLLMIGGCFGNLIDRAGQFIKGTIYYQKGVVDFISFQFGSYHFPTFNIADSCLVIGVIILIIMMLIDILLVYKYKDLLKGELKKLQEDQENEIDATLKEQKVALLKDAISSDDGAKMKEVYLNLNKKDEE